MVYDRDRYTHKYLCVYELHELYDIVEVVKIFDILFDYNLKVV